MEEQISLNTKTGDVLRYLNLRGRPSDLNFGCIKEDQSSSNNVDNRCLSVAMTYKLKLKL